MGVYELLIPQNKVPFRAKAPAVNWTAGAFSAIGHSLLERLFYHLP